MISRTLTPSYICSSPISLRFSHISIGYFTQRTAIDHAWLNFPATAVIPRSTVNIEIHWTITRATQAARQTRSSSKQASRQEAWVSSHVASFHNLPRCCVALSLGYSSAFSHFFLEYCCSYVPSDVFSDAAMPSTQCRAFDTNRGALREDAHASSSRQDHIECVLLFIGDRQNESERSSGNNNDG